MSVHFNVGDPFLPKPLKTSIMEPLGADGVEVLEYPPKAMIAAEKLAIALQWEHTSQTWSKLS